MRRLGYSGHSRKCANGNQVWTLAPADPSAVTSGELILSCTVPFSDVLTTDFFFDGVRYLYCMNAIGGYSDNTFAPLISNTRAQFSKVLVLMMGGPSLVRRALLSPMCRRAAR